MKRMHVFGVTFVPVVVAASAFVLACTSSSDSASTPTSPGDASTSADGSADGAVEGPFGCLEACEPRVIADNLDTPGELHADGTAVYWVDRGNGAIRSVARDGGTITTLATDSRGPSALAFDATYIYWTARNDGPLMRVAKSGGDAEPAVPGSTGSAGVQGIGDGSLAVDDSHVFWVHGNSISAVAKAGGSVATINLNKLQSDGSNVVAYAIALDGTDVVFTCACGDSDVWRMPKQFDDTTMPVAIKGTEKTSSIPRSFAIAGATLHWSSVTESKDPAAPTIESVLASVPKGGGEKIVLDQGADIHDGLVADARYVYFFAKKSGAQRIPIAGGGRQSLLQGLGATQSLAVDDRYVYVVDIDNQTGIGGRITRVGK